MVGSRLRRIAIDVTPLQRSRDFRWLWSGLLFTGRRLPLHRGGDVHPGLRHDRVDRGRRPRRARRASAGILLGIVVGGTFIDAVDRRTTLMWAQVGAGLGSGLLSRPPRSTTTLRSWWSTWGSRVISGVSAIDSSVRNATVPRLVGRELLPSALALNQVVMNATALLGPAVAGVVIARFGLVAAYAVRRRCPTSRCSRSSGRSDRCRRRAPARRDTGCAAVRRGFAYLRGSTGAAGRVRGRPGRDDLRHAAGAVPADRRRASSSGAPRSWACCSPRRPSEPCSAR